MCFDTAFSDSGSGAAISVTRASPRDSRAYELHLTAKAHALLARLIPGAAEVQRRIVEPLPPDMRDAFIKSMRILIGIESVSHAPPEKGDRT